MEACFNFDSQRNQNPITFTKSSNHLLPSQNYNLKGHMQQIAETPHSFLEQWVKLYKRRLSERLSSGPSADSK